MKVLFINFLKWDWSRHLEELREEFPDVEFVEDSEKDSKHLEDAEVIVLYSISQTQLERTEDLKCILIPYTGVNMFPLEELKKRGIIMGNSHGNGKVVAEHALTMTLALLHETVYHHNELKKGFWHRSFRAKDWWTSINGMNCGLLGTGGVGSPLARLLKAFECHTVGFKRSLVDEPPEFFDEVTTDLDQVIEKTDILFICLPGTEETKGMIGRKHLRKMKGGYLVNVARGPIVAEEDLFWALNENVLAGAAMDVWYNYHQGREEPVFPSELGIHELPNVVISPHNSTHSALAVEHDQDQTAENIREYIRTGKPKNLVDLDRGY
jgi:phosphoglycerate dehydrogenase-like enzyme